MKDIAYIHAPDEVVLYDGKVKLTLDRELHIYTVAIDGDRYAVAGVTSVCGMMDKSSFLTQWAANETINAVIDGIPYSNALVRHELEGLVEKIKTKSEIGKRSDWSLVTASTLEVARVLNTARSRHRAISNDAKDTGHTAHSWLERHVKNIMSGGKMVEIPPSDDRAANCVRAVSGWLRDHDFKPLMSERMMYSLKYGFGGTPDVVGDVTSCGKDKCCPFKGTVRELLDFKSSEDIYAEYLLQASAYQYGLQEELAYLTIEHRRIVRGDKTTGRVYNKVRTTSEQFDDDFHAFLGLLQAYNWVQGEELGRKETRLAKRAEKAAKEAVKKPRRVKVANPVFEDIPIAG